MQKLTDVLRAGAHGEGRATEERRIRGAPRRKVHGGRAGGHAAPTEGQVGVVHGGRAGGHAAPTEGQVGVVHGG